MAKTPAWALGALAYTYGTQFGAIIHEALRQADMLKPGSSPESTEKDRAGPRFIGKAIVTSDGFVQCSFVTRDGEHKHMAFVGSIGDLERNALGLANHLDMTTADRAKFNSTLSGWISLDYRSPSAKRISLLAGVQS